MAIKAHERRGEIIRNQLYLGGISGRVYFAPRVRVRADHGDGTALMSVVGEKYDVTEQFDRIVAERKKRLRASKRRATAAVLQARALEATEARSASGTSRGGASQVQRQAPALLVGERREPAAEQNHNPDEESK